MPKSVKKSCTTQTSISSYFGGRSSSGTQCGIKPSPAEHRLSRGKQKLSSDGHEFGLPTKRAKFSPQHRQVEDLEECEPASSQSTTETRLTSSRGAGVLCSSTLEKLKGFSCSSQPSVGCGDTQWEEKKTDGASSKICDRGSSVEPPRDVTYQHSEKIKLQQQEEEHEDEEEEAKEKESSGKQGVRFSQFTKAGGGGGGRGRIAEPSPPPVSSVSSRGSKSVYTPLEQQVIQLKQQHQDALLA